MRLKVFPVVAIALVTLSCPVFLRAQSIALRVSPGMELPIATSAQLFDLGGSLDLAGEYTFPGKIPAFASVSAGYGVNPIKSNDLVHSVAGGLGGGVYFDIVPRLSLQAFGSAGYYYSLLNDSGTMRGGGSPYVVAGVALYYLLSPTINLGAGVSYKNLLGLYNGLQIFAGTSIYFRGTEARRTRIESQSRPTPLVAKAPGPNEGIGVSEFTVTGIFPVFRNYYDDHAIGKAVLANQEKTPVTGLKASLFIRKYMDGPRQLDVPSTLAPGAKADLDLFALLNTSVMDITEGEKASAELSLEYKVGDTPYADTRVRTITLYNRNAMTWEDDRRAAAFVTRFDPVIQDYSKNFVAAIDGLGSEAVSRSLLAAVGTHQVLLLTGVKYAVDPASSYAQQVTRKLDVDYLQFPRQTLQRRGGDCDDLSILYCALLESVGIPTAFITVPGHIFMAFALDVDPADVGRTFSSTADIFTREGKAWVPIEVTERKAGFVTAWKTAAQEWRQCAAAGMLGFYPLQEAWKAYAPVQSPGGEAASGISSPPAADLVKSVKAEIAVFQEGEVAPQVLALRRQIDPRKGNPALQNKIGILYAKYGLLDRAETEFRALTANAKTAFVPAMVNMANLYFLREDYSSALRYYSQAAQKEPTAVSARLGLARASYALGKYSEAQAAMASVRKSDPQLADRFAFMETAAAGGTRAADVSANKGVAVWDE